MSWYSDKLLFRDVWDYFCEMMGVPVREEWYTKIKEYEDTVPIMR